MSASSRSVIAAAVAIGTMVSGLVGHSAAAAPQDYRFELVQPEVKKGSAAAILVRLVHVPTGKAVQDAVIFQTRLDMSPEGMGQMATPVKVLESKEPGVYPLQADLVMAGGWALNVAAKVQGEAETVKGTLHLKAAE